MGPTSQLEVRGLAAASPIGKRVGLGSLDGERKREDRLSRVGRAVCGDRQVRGVGVVCVALSVSACKTMWETCVSRRGLYFTTFTRGK